MSASRLPFVLTWYLLFLGGGIHAQKLKGPEVLKASRDYLATSVESLRYFLTIPNNGQFAEHTQANLEWCQKVFSELGFTSREIVTDGVPILFAEKDYKRKKTVLVYLQIDGQPVDTSAWHQSNPYLPVVKKKVGGVWEEVGWDNLTPLQHLGYRIFSRSASDSKGPAMAFISALRIMEEKRIKPDFNIKVVMDFQEEMGSPTLAQTVSENRDAMKADMLLIMDGTRHISNLPTLNFGARGIATVTLKVFGAERHLHSGQYGNFAPNPVFKLSNLLAGMKDGGGRVTIPGFYEGVNLDDSFKKKINDLPENRLDILESLGIADSDHIGETYQESLHYPSLNVRGLNAAWVGDEVRTIIPNVAIAEIDMRLVPETPGIRQVDLLRSYVISKGYHLVDSIPTAEERKKYTNLAAFNFKIGSEPFRTDIDSEFGKWLSGAMTRIFGTGFVKQSTTGGSQPIAPFIRTLNIPAVSLRFPNPDNNIHGPDENLELGSYLEGIQMCLAVLTEKMK